MLSHSTIQSQQGGEQKLWISLYFSIWPLEGTVVKIGKDQNKLKKTFLPYNLKRYPDTIFYTMTYKASQTLETEVLRQPLFLAPSTVSIRRRNRYHLSFLNLRATWIQVPQSWDFCLWGITRKAAHCLFTAPPWPWCSPWCLRHSCCWVSTVPFYSLVHTRNIVLVWLWIETFV